MTCIFSELSMRNIPVGLSPLKRMAAESRTFPAGFELMTGWLFQVFLWPTQQRVVTFRDVPSVLVVLSQRA